MQELVIRPTAKFIKAGAAVAGVACLALEILLMMGSAPAWQMALPPILLLWPAARWLRRKFTRAVVSGDRLRYETGIATRSTRTIQLSKIQDVLVNQGVMDRLFDVGNLSIETAGETSRLTIVNVDSPQSLADELMDRAQRVAKQTG